jgi:hypothetical protein
MPSFWVELFTSILRAISHVFQFSLVENWSSFTYLGIPISLKSSYSQVWQQILEKISKKLTYWGTQWLNPTTRVILIKVVLSSLPIYQCSTLLAPKCISNQIAKIIRSFLWQGGKMTHKNFHLVNWNQVTSDKNHGGLGIREPDLMNTTMGAKLLWRLITGKLTWWKQAIKKNISK